MTHFLISYWQNIIFCSRWATSLVHPYISRKYIFNCDSVRSIITLVTLIYPSEPLWTIVFKKSGRRRVKNSLGNQGRKKACRDENARRAQRSFALIAKLFKLSALCRNEFCIHSARFFAGRIFHRSLRSRICIIIRAKVREGEPERERQKVPRITYFACLRDTNLIYARMKKPVVKIYAGKSRTRKSDARANKIRNVRD